MEKELVLKIIKNVIKKENTVIKIDSEDEKEIIDIFITQNLSSYLYLATKDTKYLKYYILSTRFNIDMNNNMKKVIETFNEKKINHIIMKGYDTQHLYYDKALRVMGDVDIYVDPLKETLETKALENLGYKKGKRSTTHLEFSKGKQRIELHYNLFSHEEKIDNFFIEPFNHSHHVSEHTYKMNKDYYLAYLLAHYSKHFIQGGSGLRSLIDIYLLLENEDYDIKYMREYLKEIELDKFFDTVLDTINYIFETKYATVFKGNPKILIDYCLKAGVHGFREGNENYLNEMHALRENKIKFVFKRIFLPKNEIRNIYENRQPLFILYIRRILKLIFKRKRKGIKVLTSNSRGFLDFTSLGL